MLQHFRLQSSSCLHHSCSSPGSNEEVRTPIVPVYFTGRGEVRCEASPTDVTRSEQCSRWASRCCRRRLLPSLPRQLHRPPALMEAKRVALRGASVAAAHGTVHGTRSPSPCWWRRLARLVRLSSVAFTFFRASRVRFCMTPHVSFLTHKLHAWCGGLPLLLVPLNVLLLVSTS